MLSMKSFNFELLPISSISIKCSSIWLPVLVDSLSLYLAQPRCTGSQATGRLCPFRERRLRCFRGIGRGCLIKLVSNSGIDTNLSLGIVTSPSILASPPIGNAAPRNSTSVPSHKPRPDWSHHEFIICLTNPLTYSQRIAHCSYDSNIFWRQIRQIIALIF